MLDTVMASINIMTNHWKLSSLTKWKISVILYMDKSTGPSKHYNQKSCSAITKHAMKLPVQFLCLCKYRRRFETLQLLGQQRVGNFDTFLCYKKT